jgi:hypothetical protein
MYSSISTPSKGNTTLHTGSKWRIGQKGQGYQARDLNGWPLPVLLLLLVLMIVLLFVAAVPKLWLVLLCKGR